MKSEQWQQLDQIFHQALQHEPADRAAFLEQACGHDHFLRQEVNKLLAAHDEAGSFIENPAIDLEARELFSEQRSKGTELTTGEQVSHYRVISLIGSGGMGEVYLAEDT